MHTPRYTDPVGRPSKNSEPLRPRASAAVDNYIYENIYSEDQIRREHNQIFERLYMPFKEPLAKRLMNLINNTVVVDDLCQEAAFRMWKKYFMPLEHIPIEIIQGFEPLLFVIARNAGLDYIRRIGQVVLGPLPEDELAEYMVCQIYSALRIEGPEQQVCQQLCIEEALAALPTKYRVCLMLQEQWGLTQQEIATELGMSVKAVSANVRRGNKRFREIYTRLMEHSHTTGKEGSKRNGKINLQPF